MMRLIDAERLGVIFSSYKGFDKDSFLAGVEAVCDKIDATPTICCKTCVKFVSNKSLSGEGNCSYLRGMINENFGCADWKEREEK